MWKDSDVIQRKENLPWQKMEESILVLNPSNSQAHEFNGSAGFIWSHIEQEISFSNLLDGLCKKYEVDREQAQQDLASFLLQLQEKELLK